MFILTPFMCVYLLAALLSVRLRFDDEYDADEFRGPFCAMI